MPIQYDTENTEDSFCHMISVNGDYACFKCVQPLIPFRYLNIAKNQMFFILTVYPDAYMGHLSPHAQLGM